MMGKTEVAEANFNSQYGGTAIAFPRELQDAAIALTKEITKSIKESF